MDLVVQGSSNFSVSDRMKRYIEKRIKKVSYFKPHMNEIKFHLSSEKRLYKVDVVIVSKFGTYKFQATDREMYSAIDKVVHKMDVKIYREKSKIKNHSKADYEEGFINFFTEHERDEPEPTDTISINDKPTILQDAYLQMVDEETDFYGFQYIDEDQGSYPAFLRKLEDNILYLFKKKDDGSYAEYSLQTADKSVSISEEVRAIPLRKLNLLTAQKEVLAQDYYYEVFINSATNNINFLFKEGNGKWKLLTAQSEQ